MSNATSSSAFMDLFQQAALLVMTRHCFDEYFVQFNFFDGDCFKATLAKGLGFGVILGSILVKVPQILKIHKNKSGEGINIYSVTLDLSAITLYASYNFVKAFPFSSWGDSGFLAIQTAIIGVLILHYAGSTAKALAYLIIYCSIVFVLTSGITPVEVLWSMQSLNIFILLVGKLSQAYTNYSNGHTGQLSAVTLIMLFLGSVARVFTSIQETGDSMVILTCVASCAANSVVLMQLLYYWNVDVGKIKLKAKKE